MAFWQDKKLREFTKEEWESLCDGCGQCCLHKFEDEDDGMVYTTRVLCQYLDLESIQCNCYQTRQQKVPACVWLKPEDLENFHWLPDSCAYKLVWKGEPLPSWHHLVSGQRQTELDAASCVKHYGILETEVDEDYDPNLYLIDISAKNDV